jgi:hypothetical protein
MARIRSRAPCDFRTGTSKDAVTTGLIPEGNCPSLVAGKMSLHRLYPNSPMDPSRDVREKGCAF